MVHDADSQGHGDGPVAKAMATALERYHKVGLLVDDDELSPFRLARELYFSDELPAYWVRVRSVECADRALDFLQSLSFLNDTPHLRGVIIVDRRLLRSCAAGSAPNARLDRDGRHEANLVALAASTESKEPRYENMLCWLVTNEAGVGLGEDRRVDWFPKSAWLMARIRERLAEEKYRCLRRFGPTADETPQADLGWKMSAWGGVISSLAQALSAEGDRQARDDRNGPSRSHEPVVLLTGAGASLPAGPHGNGIPRTDTLLYDAARSMKGEPVQHREPRHGLCACASKRPVDAPKPSHDLTLTNFIAAAQRGEKLQTYPHLIEAFAADGKTAAALKERNSFYGQFRSLMQRFDHGFPYHHWLMAQLPWSCIISTNFDGFHERAAAAAARRPEALRAKMSQRERANTIQSILRRGNPSPMPTEPSQSVATEREHYWRSMWKDSQLFKPYGTLTSPAALALNVRHFADRQQLFGEIFDYVFGRAVDGGWLVVIGHAMQNDALQGILRASLERQPLSDKLRVVWVVPDALERVNVEVPDYWASLVKQQMTEPVARRDAFEDPWRKGENGGPVPSGALEFLYDLALEFAENTATRAHD
jgi:hypothetical protein